MMSLPLPNLLADFQELDLLPERIAKNSALCLWENRACASCSTRRTCICKLSLCASLFLAKVLTRFLSRSRFVLMSGSKKFSLLMEWSTSNRFALNIQSFSCSSCNKLNRFLRSTYCKYTFGICDGIRKLPKIH